MPVVKGKVQRDTQLLRVKDKAKFVVAYQLSHASKVKPVATLTITKNGKLVWSCALTKTTYLGQPAFACTVTVGKTWVAPKLYAHFKVMLGVNTAKRDRRFQVIA